MKKSYSKFTEALKGLVAGRVFWLCLFLVFLGFYLLIPLMVDDFTYLASWHYIDDIQGFLSMHGYLYENINGRVLSSNFMLLLVSNRLLNALVAATIMTGIAWLATRIIGARSIFAKSLIAASIFFVPTSIFSQTVVWRAGFYVYVPPVLGVLALYYLARVYQSANIKVTMVLIVVVSYITSLFVENVTLGLGIFAVLYLSISAYRKSYRDLLVAVALVVGVAAGAFTMFSAPAYTELSVGSGEYRSISDNSSILSSLYTNSLTIIDRLLVDSWVLPVLMLAASIGLAILNRPNNRRQKVIPLLIAVIAIAVVYLAVFGALVDTGERQTITQLFSGALAVLLVGGMYAAFFTLAWLTVKDKRALLFTLSVMMLSIFILIPLFKVSASTISSRIFYPSYVLQIVGLLGVVVYMYNIHKNKLSDYSRRTLKLVGVATLLFLAAGVFIIFGLIAFREWQNNESARAQVQSGAKTIKLKKYPFDKLLNGTYKASAWPRMYYAECECQYRSCNPCEKLNIIYE